MFLQICGIHAAILEMKDLDTLPNSIFHAKSAASIIRMKKNLITGNVTIHINPIVLKN